MTEKDKRTFVDFGSRVFQSNLVSRRLANLIVTARAMDEEFVILDECENEFGHRNLRELDLEQQRFLYLLARDEIAKRRAKKTWALINLHPRILQ